MAKTELIASEQSASVGLIQGPRVKGYATCQLEQAVLTLLNNWQSTEIIINELGDLEIIANKQVFNISQILRFQPDFEQINLSHQDLDNYLEIIIESDEELSRKKYRLIRKSSLADSDTSNDLHLAEKMAIYLYTSSAYKGYQAFLRTTNEAIADLKNLDKLALKQKASQLLLTIVVASHGLAKPSPLTEEEKFEEPERKLYRAELFRKNSPSLKNYIAACEKKQILSHQGFTSTSLLEETLADGLPALNFSKHNVLITYKQLT